MQPKEASDKENDDADDVENVHGVLRLRHARFQHESAALQQGTFLSASRFRRPRKLFGDEAVNFIESDTVNATRSVESSGMGLGLVRRLVEQVRGSAIVNSDHGTVWTIRIRVGRTALAS
jgi:two-component sensor histidine kinase